MAMMRIPERWVEVCTGGEISCFLIQNPYPTVVSRSNSTCFRLNPHCNRWLESQLSDSITTTETPAVTTNLTCAPKSSMKVTHTTFTAIYFSYYLEPHQWSLETASKVSECSNQCWCTTNQMNLRCSSQTAWSIYTTITYLTSFLLKLMSCEFKDTITIGDQVCPVFSDSHSCETKKQWLEQICR